MKRSVFLRPRARGFTVIEVALIMAIVAMTTLTMVGWWITQKQKSPSQPVQAPTPTPAAVPASAATANATIGLTPGSEPGPR